MITTPPGPTGDRIVGNLDAFSTDPLGFLSACAREYGDVVTIGSSNVLLAHPDDIERMLVDRPGAFAKSTADTRTRTDRRGFPRAMMNSDGAVWRAKRARIAPAFGRALVSEAAEVAHAETVDVLATLPVGVPVDPAPAVSRLTLRSVSRLLFGRALPDADLAAVGDLTESIMAASLSPIALPDWVPTPAHRRMCRALRGIDAVVARLLADPPADAPVLAALTGGAGVPADELRDELATLILSGFETSKNAVLWTLDQLARHPSDGARVTAEAEAARGRSGAALLEALPVTGAAVREALRLFPPAWLTSREALSPVEFGGHRIDAGTTVTVCQWLTHRDPRWYADPTAFRLDRWLVPADRPRGAWFPFGLGPRACIGAAVATAEATVAVAELLRTFRLEPGQPPTPRPALSLQPAGMTLVLHPLVPA